MMRGSNRTHALCVIGAALLWIAGAVAFAPRRRPFRATVQRRTLPATQDNGLWSRSSSATCLLATNDDDDEKDPEIKKREQRDDRTRKESIKQLGFDDRDLKGFRSEDDNNNKDRTKVNEIEVDAFTLAAVGFALIAFNFLVLGNLGDGGISGPLATLINKFNEM